MKIACVIHSLCGGGAERVMAGLATRLADRNHDVTLVTLDNGGNDRHHVGLGVDYLPLDVMKDSSSLFDRVSGSYRRIAAIRRTLTDLHPDVVLSFCDKTNVTVLIAAIATKIPVVVAERSDPAQQELSTGWERLRRLTYPNAAKVVALTETSAKTLGPLSPRQISVIPSAIESPRTTRDHDSADQTKRILGVGRLEYEKGFDRLIKAFASANESDGWTLRIVGDGSLRRELQAQATELGIADQVEFFGWIPTVTPEYRNATIFALPSRYEGFPSALLEAMSFGVPSIAVNCESGPRAVIRGKGEALLVDDTIEALAADLRRLMDDARLRQQLSKGGKVVVERFSWSAMTDAYESLLQSEASQ